MAALPIRADMKSRTGGVKKYKMEQSTAVAPKGIDPQAPVKTRVQLMGEYLRANIVALRDEKYGKGLDIYRFIDQVSPFNLFMEEFGITEAEVAFGILDGLVAAGEVARRYEKDKRLYIPGEQPNAEAKREDAKAALKAKIAAAMGK